MGPPTGQGSCQPAQTLPTWCWLPYVICRGQGAGQDCTAGGGLSDGACGVLKSPHSKVPLPRDS